MVTGDHMPRPMLKKESLSTSADGLPEGCSADDSFNTELTEAVQFLSEKHGDAFRHHWFANLSDVRLLHPRNPSIS